MEMIADVLLIAGAAGAAIYCMVLARRLRALKDLDSGLGAAIAAMSRQVDEMRVSLDAAKNVSGDQTRQLSQLTARAEMAAGRLELLLAALHENGRERPLDLRRPAREPAEDRFDRPARAEPAERVERSARAEPVERIERPERVEPASRAEPAERIERPAPRIERAAQAESVALVLAEAAEPEVAGPSAVPPPYARRRDSKLGIAT